MLPNNYSEESFAELSDTQKWNAYNRLRIQAVSLLENLARKAGTINQKREKVDYLRAAKEELMRQTAIRNQAGSSARRVAFQARKEKVIAIFIELEEVRDRRISESEAGNYFEPDSGRITAKHVLAVYRQRHPGERLELSTVRTYVKDFKDGRDRNPDVVLTISG